MNIMRFIFALTLFFMVSAVNAQMVSVVNAPNGEEVLTANQQKGKEYWEKALVAYEQKDYTKAFKYFKKAAELDYHKSYWALAECYGDALGTQADHSKSIYWYKKAIEFGDDKKPIMINMLGVEYTCIKNQLEANNCFQKALEQGNAWAGWNLGRRYFDGRGGVQKNLNEAARLFAMAVECPYEAEEIYKAIVNDDNEYFYTTVKSGWRETKRVLTDFSKTYPDAAYALDYAKWKLNPNIDNPFEQSLKLNSDKAGIRIAQLAAEGNKWAQEQLVVYLWTGTNKGIKQDKQKAVDYCKQNKDKKLCQDILILAKGDGMYSEKIPSDWYMRKTHSSIVKEEANKGNAEAMFTLGVENEVNKNETARNEYYEKAAANGHELAKARLTSLIKEKAEAEEAARKQQELAAKQEAERKARDLALKKKSEGKQITWTETVSYDTGSGGLGEALLDAFGGSVLHEVRYTIRYTGIVEKVIAGESVKCIIKRANIESPGLASANWLKYKKYAQAAAADEVGKTRVLEMDEFELK